MVWTHSQTTCLPFFATVSAFFMLMKFFGVIINQRLLSRWYHNWLWLIVLLEFKRIIVRIEVLWTTTIYTLTHWFALAWYTCQIRRQSPKSWRGRIVLFWDWAFFVSIGRLAKLLVKYSWLKVILSWNFLLSRTDMLLVRYSLFIIALHRFHKFVTLIISNIIIL